MGHTNNDCKFLMSELEERVMKPSLKLENFINPEPMTVEVEGDSKERGLVQKGDERQQFFGP